MKRLRRGAALVLVMIAAPCVSAAASATFSPVTIDRSFARLRFGGSGFTKRLVLSQRST